MHLLENCIIDYLMQCTPTITLQTDSERHIRKIYNVQLVAMLPRKPSILLKVRARCMCCINHNELTTSHPHIKQLMKLLPHPPIIPIWHNDTSCVIHHRATIC